MANVKISVPKDVTAVSVAGDPYEVHDGTVSVPEDQAQAFLDAVPGSSPASRAAQAAVAT